MAVAVGDKAPDFCLNGSPTSTYCLSDVLGKPIVLAFYPQDHSPICSIQLRAYSEGMEDFSRLGALVWGISPQEPESHYAFAIKNKINFPLLSDTNKDVAKLYQILGPLGFYRRSIFVVNAQGTITYCHRSTAGATYRPTKDLLQAIESAQ